MTVTQYVWDQDNILYETDGNDTVNAEYTYSPEQYGELISEYRNGETYTHYYDAQGSTLAMTDEAGHVTDRFTYNAWGEEVARIGTTETPWRWIAAVGYYFDGEVGTFSVRRRTYRPLHGRWNSRDPLFPAALFLYAYASNHPVTRRDPTGLKCKPSAGSKDCFSYVHGRGDFTNLVFNTSPDPAIQLSLFSLLEVDWRPSHSFKTDALDDIATAHSCCCTEIGLVQIVRQSVKYTGVPGIFQVGNLNFDWRVDYASGDSNHGWPYSASSAATLRCGVDTRERWPAQSYPSLSDAPGISWLYGVIWEYKADFELCAVCLGGPSCAGEGPRQSDAMWLSQQSIYNLTSYGCFTWGHSFTRKD
jgi:RHS repeat-associated protein